MKTIFTYKLEESRSTIVVAVIQHDRKGFLPDNKISEKVILL